MIVEEITEIKIKQKNCQNCKHQRNKPSYCFLKKMYVGRKERQCEKFKSK